MLNNNNNNNNNNIGSGTTMAVIFTITQVFAMAATTPSPDDWSSSSPFQISSDNNVRDTFTSAFLNVSRQDETGWKWSKEDVGRFGSGYVGPAYGVLVHITSDSNLEDHTGCYLPLRSTRFDGTLPPEPWIALIKRGRCNFETKVENAFRSRAVGVLIYNDRDSANLDKMKLSSDSGRNISAVFTYKWKGEELARYLENSASVYVHITIGRELPSRTATINRTSVLFVSITFIVLMIISLAWLVFYYVQRFRHIHAKDKLSRRLCNAAKKALSKIPTKNIKSDDKEVQGDGECCAVCIEPYKVSEVLRILPCSHEFHKNCIDPWLLEHRTCPMCKMDILKHYGFVFTGSQESILHLDAEDAGVLETLDDPNTARTAGGISPLPEIRAAVISNHQMSYDSSGDEDQSSRASTPNEWTPSLPPSTVRHIPVRQELCVNCIAAASAASVLVNNQDEVKNVMETHSVQQVQNSDQSQNKFVVQ